MADNLKNISSKGIEQKGEADLPPPPPPDSAQPTVILSGTQEQSFMPLPPPKESFSKFYEQRQVNELKRLYRHMHPELRKNLEQTVTSDLTELLNTEEVNQQASVSLDTVLPGEVQSMRWIFENWNLDTIGEHQGSKKLAEEESVLGGNVKNTSLKFQGQPCEGGDVSGSTLYGKDQTKGDVKTALWLFETQPLDSLNKIYPDETEVQEAVLKEPVGRGDVKGTKLLFETHSLDAVGRCNSVEEHSILQLKSEIQELKGDVKKTVKLFQTEPMCAIRDNTGNIHEITSICREETESNSVNTTRWLFETQPLDTICKDTTGVQIIRGISLEEIVKGGVNAAKWIFETQPLDTIKEYVDDGVFQASVDTVEGADSIKSAGKLTSSEEVLAGDVKSSLWLFETQPMETLKGNVEVGQLKKVELLNEEKGDVKQRKHVFETRSLDRITGMDEESNKDECGANSAQEIIKGDVKSFKDLFETFPLDSIKKSSSIVVSNGEEIQGGNVKANQALFESTPLYAIEDSLGNYHEVTSVSREQEISGDVKNYKWMFETKPLDQFNDSPQKVDIIKGITKQEIISGDVGTARWLFETQPVDVIHQEANATEKHSSVQKEISQKGDVKKCRWLFETQPVDTLYDKSNKNQDKEALVQGNVKSCTWMFETQPIDSFKETGEQYIKVSTVLQDNLQGVDVKTTKHLFETEPLDNISSGTEFRKVIRYSSRLEMQSGEVSRVKEIFESKPKEGICVKKADIPEEENIQKGSVNKFTWLFENCPMDSMANNKQGFQEMPPEKDVKGGDVGGKKFIFETYSLDQIQQESDEMEIKKVQEAISQGDVKSCTMLFETKPLYAIQDQGGEYHEVTSVKKEEVMKGDVRGAKWLFETKPLDMIHKDEEVFVIRAVTQEDIEKGCVKSARWRFETEPLDSITEGGRRPTARTIDDVQKGDVQMNKQLFESQQLNQKKYVRLVSVSDVQKGNVRTSTWLFENQPIDCLKGDSEEHPGIITVQREDNQKGDVKRCTWLFESQPLDSLKDTEVPISTQAQEEVPKANVKSTTWLFESTPLDKFDFKHTTSMEQREINVKDTLDAFLSLNIINHKGIVIEKFDGGSVKMAKYQLITQLATDIQKEEVIGGNLQRILLQLLHRTDVEPHGLLVEENSAGELQIMKLQLLHPDEEEDKHVQGDVAKALEILLNDNASIKSGIVMEETERGSVKMCIYSISKYCRFNVVEGGIVKGDVKSTIGNLIACSQEQKRKTSVTRDDNEKGNVQLYTSCIEKGDLGYLRSLQDESEIQALMLSQTQNGKTVHQDVKHQDEQEAMRKSENQSTVTVGKDCVYVASNPTIHSMQPETKEKKGGLTADVKLTIPHEKPKNECTVQTREVFLTNANKANNELQKATTSKHTTGKESAATYGFASNTLQKECTTSNDLQAALLDLRQATAEAKSIQQQVQGKFQKSTCEIQLGNEQIKGNTQTSVQSSVQHQEGTTIKHKSSVTATVQGTQKSCASLQKSTASTRKVSATEKEEQGQELYEAVQQSKEVASVESDINNCTVSPKQMKNYLNPFIDSDFMTQSVQEEREQDIVRGDVKAAIRSLQNASSEQREVEKEEVVRGNLTSALQSLEKSNVNISKGDFKAAMIYRNAGQSYAVSKGKADVQQIRSQATVKSLPQSDNDFPPSSAAVIGQESCQPPKPSNSEATNDESTKPNDSVPKAPNSHEKASESNLDENANALNTSQTLKTQRKKPALPPKPKHLLPGVCPPPHHRPKSQMTSACSPLYSNPTDPTGGCTSKAVPHTVNTSMQCQDRGESKSQTCCAYASSVDKREQAKECLIQNTSDMCQKKKEAHIVTSQNQGYQDKNDICVSNPELDEPVSKGASDLSNDLYIHTQQSQQVETVLQKNLLPQEVKCDKNTSLNWENQDVPRRKKGVTVLDPSNISTQSGTPEVVMRVKHKRETEDEKRKRLSVHKDEIMKGNVKAAMDIFENLRKQEELENILNKVKELEEETSNVDVRSMKGLFENVPEWIVSGEDGMKTLLKEKEKQKDESSELMKEETESVSSVELAFEDLEKASSEIKHLKEQTLARLLDIEETIKKALYSVSNLKSESDIAGLSGLFRESLGTSTNTASTNNIRKISIVSSKAKPEKPSTLSGLKSVDAGYRHDAIESKKTELDVASIPTRSISPASPSFITIESAARKPVQNVACSPSAHVSQPLRNGQIPDDMFSIRKQNVWDNEQSDYFQVQKGLSSFGTHESSEQYKHWSSACESDRFCQNKPTGSFELNSHANLCPPSSPLNSHRQKSILQLKTGPEGPKLIGTKIVTEKYEELDTFGNKIIRSKTSTTVTNQSDTQSSSSFKVVSAPPRYEVTASPVLRRHGIPPEENSNSKASDTGVVFVTFGNSKGVKK